MQPCPRQHQEATMSSQLSHKSHWREDRTCSYCGSISPEYLFESIKQGCTLGPTDKNYKIYVDLIEPHPEELHIVAVSTDIESGEGWIPADPARLEKEGFRGVAYKSMIIKARGPVKFGKFYFQHLNGDERQQFVDLLNQKKLKIGYPGYFYVMPYFIIKSQPPTALKES